MPLGRWLHVLRLRVRSLARGRQLDRDLDDELRYHVEELTRANVARGMSADDARRAALVAMGGVELQKEVCRDARAIRPLDELASDLRHAWRMCAKDRGTTIVAFATRDSKEREAFSRARSNARLKGSRSFIATCGRC